MKHERKELLADWIAGYEEEMYHLAYALLKNEADAQDAVGDVIVTVFEQKPQFESKEAFRPWLIQCLLDQVQEMLQNRQTMEDIPDMEEVVCDKVSEEPEEDQLWNVVEKLDATYRMMILLYCFESFSLTEISEIIRQPVSVVCARLERAREMLKKMWDKSCEKRL